MVDVKVKDKGECYRRAFNCACDYDGSHDKIREMFGLPDHRELATLLVHGFPTGTGGDAEGKLIGHAWVECRINGMNWCFDFLHDDVTNIPKVMYYRVGKIDENLCVKYTPEEARLLVLEKKVWSHWSDNIPENAHFAV